MFGLKGEFKAAGIRVDARNNSLVLGEADIRPLIVIIEQTGHKS